MDGICVYSALTSVYETKTQYPACPTEEPMYVWKQPGIRYGTCRSLVKWFIVSLGLNARAGIRAKLETRRLGFWASRILGINPTT